MTLTNNAYLKTSSLIIVLLLVVITITSGLNLFLNFIDFAEKRNQPIETPVMTQETATVTGTATATPETLMGELSPIVWEYMFIRVGDIVQGPFGAYDMTIFEGNTTIGVEGNPVTLKKINDLGREGWELVSILGNYGEINAVLVFKRKSTP